MRLEPGCQLFLNGSPQIQVDDGWIVAAMPLAIKQRLSDVHPTAEHPYNHDMAILSTTFGRVELSGKEADRFQRHMTEDKPNPAAKASLARGQAMLARIASIRQTKVNSKR